MDVKQVRLVAVSIGVVAVVGAAAGGFIVGRGLPSDVTSASPGGITVEEWWSRHSGDVDALRSSIHDSQQALGQEDIAALGPACLKMHDDAAITLMSRLPAPDPELTALLKGAVEDAHAAAHMCLAAKAGSLNNYAGEFRSQMAESDRQLEAGEDLMGGRPAAA